MVAELVFNTHLANIGNLGTHALPGRLARIAANAIVVWYKDVGCKVGAGLSVALVVFVHRYMCTNIVTTGALNSSLIAHVVVWLVGVLLAEAGEIRFLLS